MKKILGFSDAQLIVNNYRAINKLRKRPKQEPKWVDVIEKQRIIKSKLVYQQIWNTFAKYLDLDIDSNLDINRARTKDDQIDQLNLATEAIITLYRYE